MTDGFLRQHRQHQAEEAELTRSRAPRTSGLGESYVSTVTIIRVLDKKTRPAELRVLIWKAPDR